MKKLIIVGAGGFGREILVWASQVQAHQGEWQLSGFLDQEPEALSGFGNPLPIFGDPASYRPCDHDVFVCAIGDPSVKLRVCQTLLNLGARFVTLVHPTAIVGRDCRIGQGCILCPGVVVTTNVTLGNFVALNVGVCVGHDATIGDGCTLSPHSDMGGFSSLAEAVFLGTHATVLPKAVVGARSIVGAGSVVLKKVRAGATVVGVPAKEIFAKEPSS